MNRRQFLRFAVVPVAAAIALPELTRTIFLPPRGGWTCGVGHNDINVLYSHQAYALGYAITEDVVEDGLYEQPGNELITMEQVCEEILMRLGDGRIGRLVLHPTHVIRRA